MRTRRSGTTSAPARRRRAALTAACAGLIIAALSAPAQAQEPTTLDGEQFNRVTLEQTATCDGPGHGTFGAIGPAVGPIPGQFEESGEFTFTPATGALLTLTATFTLIDEMGNVAATGTKFLPPGAGSVVCAPGATVLNATVGYEATVYGSPDSGTAQLTASNNPATFNEFHESFVSAPAPPPAPACDRDAFKAEQKTEKKEFKQTQPSKDEKKAFKQDQKAEKKTFADACGAAKGKITFGDVIVTSALPTDQITMN